MMGPQYTPLAGNLQKEYIEKLRKLRYLEEQAARQINASNPSPPTGAGPNPDRVPGQQAPTMPQRSERAGPRSSGPMKPPPKTKTLSNGTVVTIETE